VTQMRPAQKKKNKKLAEHTRPKRERFKESWIGDFPRLKRSISKNLKKNNVTGRRRFEGGTMDRTTKKRGSYETPISGKN